MDDYISREAAVEKITFLCELREIVCNPDDEFLRGLKNALNAVKSNELIPSADVQPMRRGRWIEHSDWIECNVCGFEVNDRYCEKRDMISTDTSYDFCPKCAADMRGDANE